MNKEESVPTWICIPLLLGWIYSLLCFYIVFKHAQQLIPVLQQLSQGFLILLETRITAVHNLWSLRALVGPLHVSAAVVKVVVERISLFGFINLLLAGTAVKLGFYYKGHIMEVFLTIKNQCK